MYCKVISLSKEFAHLVLGVPFGVKSFPVDSSIELPHPSNTTVHFDKNYSIHNTVIYIYFRCN